MLGGSTDFCIEGVHMATILIVDDDAAFLDSLHDMLSKPGYDVLRASTGPDAIRLLETHREAIDLAIVDLSLPGLNGFEIIGAVSRRPNSVKLIATTGVYRDNQLEVAGVLGAHAAIRKPSPGSPLPEQEWLSTVRRLIGSAQGEKSARAGQGSATQTKPESPNGKERNQ